METKGFLPVLKPKRKLLWLRVLLTTFGFYLVGIATLFLSNNPNLFPPVILIGSFMVPITYITFFYERLHLSQLRMPILILTFFYGGFIGVFAASLLEPFFIQRLTFVTAFEAGLIEEFVKILGVFIIAWRWGHAEELDGIILGAVAGMSFAALESTGYAFTAFLSSNGNLRTTLAIVLVRGVLSPLGHGTWTAIFAGVLFRETKSGHFRINLRVIGAYLLVVGLHGLWDGLPIVVTSATGSSLTVAIVEITIGLTGLTILFLMWREAVRLQNEALALQISEIREAGVD